MTPSERDVRLPASAFYWAVLEPPPGTRSRRAARDTWLNLLETQIPVAIEDVHAAFVPLDDGRVIACAMERSRLSSLVTDDPITLGPESIPDAVCAALGKDESERADVPHRLNLLHGAFEPRAVRATHRRQACLTLAAFCVTSAALTLGLERRTDALREQEARTRAALARLYDEVAPGNPTQPGAIRMTAELRRLRLAGGAKQNDDVPRDATHALASVLAAWPAHGEATLEAGRARAGDVSLTVLLPPEHDANAATEPLTQIPGWIADQPAVSRDRAGTRVQLRLSHAMNGATP